jgi:transcription antitermination protein NusB
MAARHRSRQRALQVLYQCDLRKQPVEDAIASFYDTLYSEEGEPSPERDDFMEELAKGTSGMAGEIDHQIAVKAENWKLERMPAVDRNILRMAIYEMSRKETPAAVVIDEALELARQFSGEESISFINGVLDAVNRENAAASGGL